ncbi:uncharacterized protein IUM83_08906 [Phytophthora cinnamomi]|uniref:uncharacterized protein n=1 Tax=Phytophthora cinnamomi TaxID=4785 RepID=UPI00355AB34A|nr:hypothetical protein IUM83_08906 [Phytophthora cinnamomi]
MTTLKVMAIFSAPELDALWALIEPAVTIAWTQGRGRKPSTFGKDAFFITLTMLKHFDPWQKHAIDFNIGMSTLEKMVHRVIHTVESVLYPQWAKRVKMSRHMEAGNTFVNYTHALYAIDVKFQSAYRPSGRFTKQQVYVSAKHKLYGFKIECLVDPQVSQSMMLRNDGTSTPEIGDEPTKFPEMWAVLVDKGYQGVGRVFRTIQPKKKPRGGTLDRNALAPNKAVSAD